MKKITLLATACLLAGPALACGDDAGKTAAVIIHGSVGSGEVYSDTFAVSKLCDLLKASHVAALALTSVTTTQPWPAAWSNAQTAVRYLRDNGYDKVGIIGVSAGAYDALGAALSDGPLVWNSFTKADYPGQRSKPDYAVAISAVSDLTQAGLDKTALEKVIGQVSPPAAHLPFAAMRAIASPVVRVHTGGVPLFVVQGVNDTLLLKQAKTLDAQFSYVHANGTVLFTPGGHGLSGYTTAGLSDMLSAVGTFVTQQAARK